jgi:phenylalanyl-tRNA synthetase beta chain
MGGKYCEVNESTKSIFLEAALFNPILVRRARRKLGLQSESAYRFERGVDTDSVHQASYRALDLIQKLGGGDFVLAKAYGLQENKSKKISLSGSCVEKILGIKIAPTRIKRILDTLGFRVKAKSKDTFTVEVPTHRQDVDLEVDLIEEIARIHGYETIPESLPAIKPQITVLQTRDTVSLAKKILVGMGLNEVITYSLIGKDALEACAIVSNSQTIGILNPLSKEQEILRPSLIFGLANCVAYNLNQQQEYVNIFEIAKVFSGPPSKPREELVLGVALCGTRSSFISGHGLVKEETVFLHLKGILERLFVKLAIKDYSFRADGNPYSFAIYVAEEKIGILNKIEKSFLDKLDIKNKDLFILEVSLDKIFLSAQFKKKFVALPKYPAILRDISFIMKDDILTSEILEAAKEKAGPLLCEVKVADFYKGKQIPDGYRGLTISCLYRSEERTLTEAEINPLHNLICGMLTECFGVKLR